MGVLYTNDFASATNMTNIVAGNPLIVSGGRLQPTSIGDSGGYATTDMGSPDNFAQCEWVFGASVINVFCSVIARWDGAGDMNAGTYYRIQNSAGAADLVKRTGGTISTVATVAAQFVAMTTYTVRIECLGDKIGMLVNGSHIGSSPYTDSSVTTGNKVGSWFNNPLTATDLVVDNFSAGDFFIPPSLPRPFSSALLRR